MAHFYKGLSASTCFYRLRTKVSPPLSEFAYVQEIPLRPLFRGVLPNLVGDMMQTFLFSILSLGYNYFTPGEYHTSTRCGLAT